LETQRSFLCLPSLLSLTLPSLSSALSEGIVHSFAAATDDSQVLSFSESNGGNDAEDKALVSQQLASEGWLAACMTSSASDREDSEPQIHIFSPLSEKPLCSSAANTMAALHLSFWRSPDPTFPFSRGLLAVTKEAQLLLLSPASGLSSDAAAVAVSDTGVASAVVNLTLKNKQQGQGLQGRGHVLAGLSVPITLREERKKKRKTEGTEESNETDSEEESEEEEEREKKQKKMVTKITSEVFDSSSSSLPPLSSIYGTSLLHSLMSVPSLHSLLDRGLHEADA
jgi:hypothetical protein